MSHHTDPIAYAYEADNHCPDCAEERFGRCREHGEIACCVEDAEGNEPGAVFPWTEWWEPGECEVLVCGDCWAHLDTAHAANCEGGCAAATVGEQA